MLSVGVFEAKAQLSSLLDRVAGGEEVVITRHGTPVARLIGPEQLDRKRATEAFDKLLELRRGTTLGGLSWKALRDAGRP